MPLRPAPGNGDRARAATNDPRAIFAESGPQREAVFSADVQRRARKQAQQWRPRDGVGHVVGRNSGAASRGTSLLVLVV